MTRGTFSSSGEGAKRRGHAVVGEVAAVPDARTCRSWPSTRRRTSSSRRRRRAPPRCADDEGRREPPVILGSLTSPTRSTARPAASPTTRPGAARTSRASSPARSAVTVKDIVDVVSPLRAVNRPASLGQADVASMAWGVAATISAQVAHDASKAARPSWATSARRLGDRRVADERLGRVRRQAVKRDAEALDGRRPLSPSDARGPPPPRGDGRRVHSS